MAKGKVKKRATFSSFIEPAMILTAPRSATSRSMAHSNGSAPTSAAAWATLWPCTRALAAELTDEMMIFSQPAL